MVIYINYMNSYFKIGQRENLFGRFSVSTIGDVPFWLKIYQKGHSLLSTLVIEDYFFLLIWIANTFNKKHWSKKYN